MSEHLLFNFNKSREYHNKINSFVYVVYLLEKLSIIDLIEASRVTRELYFINMG